MPDFATQKRDNFLNKYISNTFSRFYRYVSITYFTCCIMLAREENKNVNNDDKQLQKYTSCVNT